MVVGIQNYEVISLVKFEFISLVEWILERQYWSEDTSAMAVVQEGIYK